MAVLKLTGQAARQHPLPRRPARRRQDVARAVDRRRHRPPVRAHLARRRARRGRDPRPPAHLRRRAAGRILHALKKAQGEEPGRAARRDRQARPRAGRARPKRRCSRCSIPSRTRPSPTTTSSSRSTCRRCCSSAPPTTSRRCRAPLRDRLEIIELRGYTADEKLHIAQAPPRPQAAQGARASPRARSPSPTTRSLAIVRDYTREAGVRQLEPRAHQALPRARSRGRARAATSKPHELHVDADESASLPRQGALLQRGAPSARACRAWPPASPGRRSAATSSSSRPRACRARAGSRSPASSAT